MVLSFIFMVIHIVFNVLIFNYYFCNYFIGLYSIIVKMVQENAGKLSALLCVTGISLINLE
jgi:hypothetical protein